MTGASDGAVRAGVVRASDRSGASADKAPASGGLTVLPVRGIGEVRRGDDLARAITGAVDLEDGDIVVVAQKVVSKAEGAVVRVPADTPAAEARLDLARGQARRVVADAPGVLVVETAHGFVCANAGIDASNAEPGTLLLLPDDPDASATAIRTAIRDGGGPDIGVVVTDTFGRPWRHGQTDVAIGVAGVACIRDERARTDRTGRPLEVTRVAVVDEIAAAADLVRRKAEGVPVCILRGLDWDRDDGAAATQLLRSAGEDHFLRGRGRLAAALGAPEALRTVTAHALHRATDQVRTVLAHPVDFTATCDDGRWRLTCDRRDRNGGEVADGLQGAATALLAAVLADDGYPASLVVEPEPCVEVGPPRADRSSTVHQPSRRGTL